MLLIQSYLTQIIVCFFFFNDTATTEIYTLSLHDALPISDHLVSATHWWAKIQAIPRERPSTPIEDSSVYWRSEEHTSELQSHSDLVCRLLLEKKKKSYKELLSPTGMPADHRSIDINDDAY